MFIRCSALVSVADPTLQHHLPTWQPPAFVVNLALRSQHGAAQSILSVRIIVEVCHSLLHREVNITQRDECLQVKTFWKWSNTQNMSQLSHAPIWNQGDDEWVIQVKNNDNVLTLLTEVSVKNVNQFSVVCSCLQCNSWWLTFSDDSLEVVTLHDVIFHN